MEPTAVVWDGVSGMIISTDIMGNPLTPATARTMADLIDSGREAEYLGKVKVFHLVEDFDA
jgi:hypothetical protein